MKRVWSLMLVISAGLTTLNQLPVTGAAHIKEPAAAAPAAATRPPAVEPQKHETNPLSKLSRYFEENKGQAERSVRFLSRRGKERVYLSETSVAFDLGQADAEPLRMKFADANAHPKLEGVDRMPGITNYYRGNQWAHWVTNVPHFARVQYRDLYQGIDLLFHDSQGALEYDFIVAPGADPNQIRLQFDNVDQISLDQKGDLVLRTSAGEIRQHAPVVYQELNGKRQPVEGQFVHGANNTVSFSLAEYDHSRQLVIDPVIIYLTYIGGNDGKFDEANGIAADPGGNAYVVGITDATDFPEPDSRRNSFGTAVYVAKLDPAGRDLLYLTFLDGEASDGRDFIEGDRGGNIAVDANGNAYVTASTFSDRFPTTPGAFQRNRSFCGPTVSCAFNNNDAFVAKLDSRGQIDYATYLGGRKRDAASGIAVDTLGRAYVVGTTNSGTSFPLKDEFQTTGFFGGVSDAYLTVFNADGSDIVYSTGLGGRGADLGLDVGIDSTNGVYVTGATETDDFPTRNAFQSSTGGGRDGFVAKFNTARSGDDSLVFSTYVGGSGTENSNAIVVTPEGRSYITGVTGSFNYPLLNPIDSTNEVNEAFVTELSSNGALVNSTFLGGRAQEFGQDIDTDNLGNIWITGKTTSSDFPSAVPFQPTIGSDQDGFVTKLRFGGAPGVVGAILGSSFLGGNDNEVGSGIALLNGRVVYVCGSTISTDLPTTPGALKTSSVDQDGFVARILDTHRDAVGIFRPSTIFLITQSITTIGTQTATAGLSGQLGVAGDWNGDGVKTVGSFSNGVWRYRNVNFITTPATPAVTVNFGLAGDIPVVGDWNGDGVDTPGVFRPSTAQFFLTNSTSLNPGVDLVMNFGAVGDRPVAGDWDGDGVDSVAVFRSNQATFFFTNENVPNPGINGAAFFGTFGDRPIAGDWNGDGRDTFGVFHPSSAEFQLTDDNVTLLTSFAFGTSNDQPIAGDWDGRP